MGLGRVAEKGGGGGPVAEEGTPRISGGPRDFPIEGSAAVGKAAMDAIGTTDNVAAAQDRQARCFVGTEGSPTIVR